MLDTTLCDKVCATPVSSTNKTDRYDITEILLKVALNTITPLYFILQEYLEYPKKCVVLSTVKQ
jgi:hypothetical protein